MLSSVFESEAQQRRLVGFVEWVLFQELFQRDVFRRHIGREAALGLIAESYFRIEQMEAVLGESSRKLLRARQSRSESSWEEWAMKSQSQSALRRSHKRSIGLKSGE